MKLTTKQVVDPTQVHPFDLYYSQALVTIALIDITCRSDQIPAAAFKLATACMKKRQEYLKGKLK